jgi:hypothetical protein
MQPFNGYAARAVIYTGYYYSGGLWRQHSWNVCGAEIIDMHDYAEMRFGVVPSDPAKFMLDAFTAEWNFKGLDQKVFIRAVGPRAERRFREVLRTWLAAHPDALVEARGGH